MKSILLPIFCCISFVLTNSKSTDGFIDNSKDIRTLTEDLDLTGQWKGSYLLNMRNTPFDLYLSDKKGQLEASIDMPKQNSFDVEHDISIENDIFLLSKNIREGVKIEFKGNIVENQILGYVFVENDGKITSTGTFYLVKNVIEIVRGDAFPEFEITSLDEKVLNLNGDFKGKYTLVDFWATNCGNCVAKRPKLEVLHSQFSNDLNILSISLDKEKSTVENFRKNRFPMDWHHTIKSDALKDPFVKKLVNYIPTAYLLDKDGNVVALGGQLNGDNIEQTISDVMED